MLTQSTGPRHEDLDDPRPPHHASGAAPHQREEAAMNSDNVSSQPDDAGWTQALTELSRTVIGSESLDASLRRVTELAKQNLPGVEDVSITLMKDNGKPQTVVFTGQLAVDLDERQYRAGFGPCMDAAVTGQTLLLDADEPASAYREFAQVAERAGIRHVMSIGLPVAQRTVGGMNVYGTAKLPFDRALVERAETFAGYAGIALNNAAEYARLEEHNTHLSIAMESRAVIEQAKGIIMGRERCTADDAFEILRRVSQAQQTKLHAVAQAIVDAATK
jgi:transcriptional regulator with GAF, ATPase, and Fis domain